MLLLTLILEFINQQGRYSDFVEDISVYAVHACRANVLFRLDFGIMRLCIFPEVH